MTSALTEHTLWEVLELNFRLDEYDAQLEDAQDVTDLVVQLAMMMIGGYRY